MEGVSFFHLVSRDVVFGLLRFESTNTKVLTCDFLRNGEIQRFRLWL